MKTIQDILSIIMLLIAIVGITSTTYLMWRSDQRCKKSAEDLDKLYRNHYEPEKRTKPEIVN